MKTILKTMAILATASALQGAQLDPSHVSDEAKWLVHVDVHQVRTSDIGSFGIEQAKALLQEEMGPIGVNLDALIEEVESITAYGSSFEQDAPKKSVLMIAAGDKAQAMIEGYIAHDELTNEGESQIKELSGQEYRTYVIGGEIYMAFPTEQSIMVSQSLEKIEHARRVVEGRAANLLNGESDLILHQQEGFFVMASLQGLDRIQNIPPQARILSKATGGQIALGESEGVMRANLVLTTKTDEVAEQLSRIIQGMIALASFIELEGNGIEGLVDNINVTAGPKMVELSLSYPSDDVLYMIELAQEMAQEEKAEVFEFVAEETNDAVGGVELQIVGVEAISNSRTPADRAIDGDIESYWSADGRGQWLNIELESVSLVREIQVDWYKGHLRQARFLVETSDDGELWKPLVKKVSSGRSYELESYNVPDVSTRWIRIKGFGNTENGWNSIKEIRFIGEPEVTQ